jgi:hypothetical protein
MPVDSLVFIRWLRGITAMMAGLGAALAFFGLARGLPGLEHALALVNNQMAVLPMGLSHILEITTHLNIPLSLPLVFAISGVALMAPSLLVRLRILRAKGNNDRL